MFVQNEETTLAYDSDEQILALKRSILFFFASFTSIVNKKRVVGVEWGWVHLHTSSTSPPL